MKAYLITSAILFFITGLGVTAKGKDTGDTIMALLFFGLTGWAAYLALNL